MGESLEALAARGRDGDREALEQLVGAIQRRIYGLSLRMLWHPEDARDATQEILDSRQLLLPVRVNYFCRSQPS